MQTSKSVSYVLEDPDWMKKVLIGSLITSIPVVEAITDGYQIQTIKNIQAGHRYPLPSWDDATQYFKQGISLRLAIYAIYIPTFITAVLAIVLTLSALFGWFMEDRTLSRDLSIARLIGFKLFIPIIDIIVLALVPLVLLVVPAMARRLADGESFFALFNPFATLNIILSNFSLYVTSRIVVIIVITLASIISAVISGVGAVIAIGPLLGWLVVSASRFWGRLIWAYHLAYMKR